MFILQCFLKLKRRYLTFKAANEMCETFGGTLPSITSQADQGMLLNWRPITVCSPLDQNNRASLYIRTTANYAAD